MKRVLLVTAAALVAAVASVAVQLWQSNVSLTDLWTRPVPFNLQDALREGRAIAGGDRIAFVQPRHVGRAITPDNRPLVANVAIADLDRDGRTDILSRPTRRPIASSG